MVLFFHLGMRLAVMVFIAGIALIFAGFSAMGLAMKTKDKPTPITAAELSRSGPPKDNAYVHVTNYGVNIEYIALAKEKAADTEPWSGAWMQIIPLENGHPVEGGKPIVLKDASIQNGDGVASFSKYKAFDAIVVNGTSTVDAPATPAGMQFPSVNDKDDWVLEMKARPDAFYAFGLTALGVLCCVGAIVPAYLQGRKMRASNAAASGITSRKL